jgi:hypothetical protein
MRDCFFAEMRGSGWRKMRLLCCGERRKGRTQGHDRPLVKSGGPEMSFVKTAIAAAALSLAAFASTGLARAADLPVKAVKKAPDSLVHPDHNRAPGVSNYSCTESTVYTGITVKF